MARRSPFMIYSFAAHAALGLGLGYVEVTKSHAATAIEFAEAPKPQKAPEPAKIDPEPVKPEPVRAPTHRAAAPTPAQNTPPPPAPVAAAAAPAADALPDFGLSLTGGVGGDGLAVPMGGGPARAAAPAAAPVRRAVAAKSALTESECEEPLVKPKARNVPQPEYTATARAAGIEGKVRVKITVDETGKVVDVQIISGLGYGLDEAALAAARTATFEPATQCGKTVRATFNLAMRFSAG